MAYYKDLATALKPFNALTREDVCFECGEPITSSVVRYDGHADAELLKSIFMHPKCAALMGQRLITDGFPNRRG